MDRLREWFCKNAVLLAAGGLGGGIFILIYGTRVLNPCYTDWLLRGGDLSQHYLGWKLYRNGEWTFPIGLTNQLAYPHYTSVIFTDSIPIFAVLFKLLSPILPNNFQYFGLWGIMCFVLQGILSAKILQKFFKEDIMALTGAVLFILNPVVFQRMFGHTSLAAHWLILLAVYTIVYYEESFYKIKNAVIIYGLLGFLSSMIHLYFIPMIGMVLCGFLLVSMVKSKKILPNFFPLVSFLVTAIISIYLMGGFHSNANIGDGGLRLYSFNLNNFFNPRGYSCFLKDLTTYTEGQGEGFAYQGLGILFLFFVTLLHAAGEVRFSTIKLNKQMTVKHIKIISCMLIALLSLAMAASPAVSFGEHLLVEISIPEFIEKVWSAFRATGRMAWPAVYLFVLFAICGDRTFMNRYHMLSASQAGREGIKVNLKLLTLVFCIVLQVADLRGILKGRHEGFSKEFEYQSMLSDPFWEEAINEKKIEHFIFANLRDEALVYSIAELASDHHIDIGNFNFARVDKGILRETLNEALTNLRDNNLYLFTKGEQFQAVCFEGSLYHVDNLFVGYAGDLNAEKMTEQEIRKLMSMEVEFRDNMFLSGSGEDRDGIRYLDQGAYSYGPYIALPKGVYKVTIYGKGLQNAEVWSRGEGGTGEIYNFNISDEIIEYDINVTENIQDMEILIQNISDSRIQIEKIRIEMLEAGGL